MLFDVTAVVFITVISLTYFRGDDIARRITYWRYRRKFGFKPLYDPYGWDVSRVAKYIMFVGFLCGFVSITVRATGGGVFGEYLGGFSVFLLFGSLFLVLVHYAIMGYREVPDVDEKDER